jgi:hypothetical protein
MSDAQGLFNVVHAQYIVLPLLDFAMHLISVYPVSLVNNKDLSQFIQLIIFTPPMIARNIYFVP